MNRTAILPLLAVPVLLFAPSCSGGSDGGSPGPDPSPRASEYTADVAVDWEELLYARVKAKSVSPASASRTFGYVGLALWESIAPGVEDGRSLQGLLNDFPAGTIPPPEDEEHHWGLAANRALAVVCAGLVTGSQAQFDALEQSYEVAYSAGVEQDVIDRSILRGEEVGNAVLAYATTDGFAALAACNAAFVPPAAHDTPAEGGWTQVPPAVPVTNPPVQPCWGTLRTFVAPDSQSCAAAGPPAYSTTVGSAWHSQALLVYNTTGDAGANLSADEKAIAVFWADSTAATGTPAGHWVSITAQVCDDADQGLDVAAEAFARVGLAVADAVVTSWQTKYEQYLMRPATYIRTQMMPTPDAAWDPFLNTPNFPTYTSDHATLSGAAAAVLTGQLGTVAFTDRTHTALNPELLVGPNAVYLANRSFASFNDAASEATVSRMYGGIHYPFDNLDGYAQGGCIGSIHNATLQFHTGP